MIAPARATVLLAREFSAERELLLRCLAAEFPAGGEVQLFSGAEEGIRLLSGRQVDLVVMRADPRGDCRSLLALACRSVPGIPVLGIVPAVTPEPSGRVAEAFFEMLSEPLLPGRLVQAVRNALRWHDLARRLHEKEQELQTLDEVARTIISSLELKTVLNIIMEKTRELVQAEAWSLFLVDDEGRELRSSIAVGENADRLRQATVKIGEGVPGWVAREGKPVVVHDAAADPRWGADLDPALEGGIRSVLCVPLETRGRVLGVIEVLNKREEGAFTERDLNVVTKLAGFAAIAIENARLYQQTKLLSLTDELTKLYNTRFFTQYLDTEVKRCRRYKSSVALIFLDLDFFKKVNDQHGHLAGSKLLREVAEVLRNGVRDVDIVARYGGDEFIVILPETGLAEAARVAERLRSRMNERVFLGEEGLDIRITASFGVAAFPETCATEEELIRLADQAMYRVKNRTRNGVYLADASGAGAGEGKA